MTVEIRRISYKTGAQARVNAAYEEALAARNALSPLGGYFNVEIGPLNTAIELFWYPDRATRDEVAEKADGLAGWPLEHEEIKERSEPFVLEDAPFSKPIEPGSFGAVYELRTYRIQDGYLDDLFNAWAEKLPLRTELSPLVGAWWAAGEGFEWWVHLWAYPDAGERQRVRAAAAASGNWPPHTAVSPVTQENLLAVPAAFSPLR